jgi:GrpB-like predicted nucleotidyltransferase (UPF0157 family)
VQIQPESSLRIQVERAVERNSRVIRTLAPNSEVEHIGATSVPGALTKGGVDLLVRVSEADFQDALARLAARYAPHYPDDWTSSLASFKEQPERDLPVGVQLVVAGSEDDRLFVSWRERLLSDPDLLDRYNSFKASHEGDEYEEYTEAKAGFIAGILGRRLARNSRRSMDD